MNQAEGKKEWAKPQIMDLGAEMTQFQLLGDKSDGFWNEYSDDPVPES